MQMGWSNIAKKSAFETMNSAELKEDGGFYQRTVVNERNYRDRVVDKRLLFLPISKSELRKVPLLDQNPGYSD